MNHAVSPHVLLARVLGGMCCIGTLGQYYHKNTGETNANMAFSAASPTYSLDKWCSFISDLSRLPAV